ncbi:hypothetical protein BU16DRAFT_544640 [Lophium mytilinum]|uniref:Azaphilone pigments biosynthesis cluster protein L N-terminal domain-containing protein n=1 Tax=Lophium mytilinum TaxID=390894 RepID=A0A6A6QA66_9PEZI|nr:hypothetical protein BU16DRAFT_544640 [Lophium mytilinum]
MADPLSAIAGVVGILDVAARTSSQVWKLIEAWRNAPTQILDLSEEIHTSRRVSTQLQTMCDALKGVSESDPFVEILAAQIDTARTICVSLDAILQSIGSTSPDTRRRIRKEKWLQAKSKVADLQSQLARVRSNVMLLLCIQSALRGVQLEVLLRTQHDAVMNLLRPRSPSTLNATVATSTIATFENKEESLEFDSASPGLESFQPGTRVISLATPRRVVCKSSCKCTCHLHRSYNRFHLAGFNKLIRSVKVAYSTPTDNASTHEASCLRATFASFEMSYSFPSWLLNISILTVVTVYHGTPTFGLIFRRRIPLDSATLDQTLFRHVARRDFLGAKAMLALQGGGAQVHDVNSCDGASALHLAMQQGSVAMVKLLLAAGADPLLENDYGCTPVNNAAKWVFNQHHFRTVGKEFKKVLPWS